MRTEKRPRSTWPSTSKISTILCDGTRDVLGLWIKQTEGAMFWLWVVNDLKLLGVQVILIVAVDGLKGLPERSTRPPPPGNDSPDLHRASDAELAGLRQLERPEIGRSGAQGVYLAPKPWHWMRSIRARGVRNTHRFPHLWRRVWDQVIRLYAFAPDIRKIAYTTNAIERLHMQLRRS